MTRNLNNHWTPNSFFEAALACVAGVILLIVSYLVLRGIAWLHFQLAQFMLNCRSER